jgi:hypothetical protein
VKGGVFAGEALKNNSGLFVNKYTHAVLPLCRGDRLGGGIVEIFGGDEGEP